MYNNKRRPYNGVDIRTGQCCISVCLYIWLCLSVYICLFICLLISLCLSACLFVCLSVCLSLSLWQPTGHQILSRFGKPRLTGHSPRDRSVVNALSFRITV